jgi:segregation and condensation protein B
MDTDISENNLELEVQENESERDLQFVDSFQLISVIESLLFASDKALTMGALKQVFAGTTVDTKTIKQTMDEMMRIYADPTRGVSLEEVVGGWQLRTKLDNMDFLKKIVRARPFRLSGPALEVLSIIAYKQPIIKHEMDQIRGVESGHLVRALMDKGLVSFEGKTDLPGKPMAYSTTRKFLEIFGLRNLNELPTLGEIDQLLPDGIGADEEEEEEKETLSDVTDEMSTHVTTSSYSEGEEELLDITDKLGAINTSTEFFEQEKLRQKNKREKERAEDIREALAMGELVESKDKRWLAKYEEQFIVAPVEGEIAGDASEEVVVAAGDLVPEMNEDVEAEMILEPHLEMPQDFIADEEISENSNSEENEEEPS